MDLLKELECMAANTSTDNEVSGVDITRWQSLFGFSLQEARKQIELFRSDLGRTSISEELWLTQAAEHEALGHNKESFEFSLARKGGPESPSTTSDTGGITGTYIIKLEGPLDTAEAIQSVLGTQCPPEVFFAHNEDDPDNHAVFCKVSACDKKILVNYVATNFPGHQLTMATLVKAVKDLGTHSRVPCLGRGMEWTLPHLRPSTDVVHKPAQDEYPVWYFFYGKLANPQLLRSLLMLDVDPVLVDATVQGGTIKTWAGKYNAMVDSSMDEHVMGRAYKVLCKEHEEALQFFETEMYEVVRCSITISGQVVDGLAFRYCGGEQQLQ